MLVCFSLLVCFFVFGILKLQKKKKHCIKQACKSQTVSTSTHRASSSNSSSTCRWRYDVFLSFYGEDTRKSFTDHLHTALKQKGILVFRDDEKLERGKSVSEELLKAIQESMYAIAVISANYASSRWCLIELAKIVECMRDTGMTVLPIFYHVDPSDVRNQTGTFAKAFAKHEASLEKKKHKVDIDMMQEWRAALGEVGKISGWHVHDRHESKVVEEISGRILSGIKSCVEEMKRNFSNVSKGLFGIESRVKDMESLLSIGLNDVRFLGICGMGGIGKTTLSKAIYERVCHQFEASCFIADIREETRTYHGLLNLQKQLISEILMERETNIWNSYGAIRVITNRVSNKKVFIVLDDVDGEEQLKALAESHDWFGEGSRIIITSRDRHLLNKYVDNTYEVQELNDVEALKLFSWKAFKKSHPEENYVELSKDIVNYAQGLPLALEVFGSFLFGRTIDAWKSARDLLKENPNAKILDKLKISFDGLEDLQKKLFLDIACFFNGAEIDSIRYKLESLGYYPNINIDVLVEKSLITISWGRLRMHDLLQKMGQQIVHCESPEEPGRCSRLWRYDNVLHVLKNNTGTDAVKGVVLNLPLRKHERLNVESFSTMKKLKMLQIISTGFEPHFVKSRDKLRSLKWHSDSIHTLEWHGDPSNFMLSNELCIMEWWGYPLESLPTSFQSDNLVELKMPYSCMKLPWDGGKSFDKLKWIDLRYSQNLIETLDLSGVPNLEKLELESCTSLSKVHPSIGFLRWLKLLNLHGCKCLKRLPDEISLESLEILNLSDCSSLNKFPDIVGPMTSLRKIYLTGTAIKKLPLSFTSLSRLVYLNISGCSRLEKIPKDLSGMKCLMYLYAGGTAIRKLPSSIVFLKELKVLDIGGKLPLDSVLDPISLSIPKSFSGLSSLRYLNLSYCNLFDGAIPNDIICLSSLKSLDLSGNKFTRIPDSVSQLSHLSVLYLPYCSWLQVLPKLPLGLDVLCVQFCPSLEMFYNQMDMWTLNEILWDIDCSFVAACIDYDGKPYKILHLRPQSPLWSQRCNKNFATAVAYGPALGSRVPEWFNDKRTLLSFGKIQMDTGLDLNYDLDVSVGYALFIVYQVHEPDCSNVHVHGNLNSQTFDGGNPNFPYFVCQFQANEIDIREPLVLCVPGVSVGPSGFWVYIPDEWFWRGRNRLCKWRSCEAKIAKALITAGSPNVEVKECGARLVRKHEASEFYQVLNSISPGGLDLETYKNFFCQFDHGKLGVMVRGPIKAYQM